VVENRAGAILGIEAASKARLETLSKPTDLASAM
jgi:hypothetical protein